MTHINTGASIKIAIIVIALTIGITITNVTPVNSHGGKTHAGESFTAFQALQKATQLYDRLITSGKLPEEWETRLKTVNIAARISAEKREYVIQFQKTEGNPTSVYFFFNQKGEYSGSNFTGK